MTWGSLCLDVGSRPDLPTPLANAVPEPGAMSRVAGVVPSTVFAGSASGLWPPAATIPAVANWTPAVPAAINTALHVGRPVVTLVRPSSTESSVGRSPPESGITTAASTGSERDLRARPGDIHGTSPGRASSRSRAVRQGASYLATPANAQVTISGNSACQNGSPWSPIRSVIMTSALACLSATAHRVAFSRNQGSSVPATR